MSNTTVSKLAIALKISSEKLISQLNEAGVNVDKDVDEITNDQKMQLLQLFQLINQKYLQQQNLLRYVLQKHV